MNRVWRIILALCIALSPAALSAPRTDALSAARFELTIDGHSMAVFGELVSISSVATLGSSQAPPTVVLRRPMTRNIEMAAWHELVSLGDVAAARKSFSLTAFNADGVPVARWHMTDGFPSKLEVGTLKAGASEVLMETVTMTCEFIQRISV
jgi:hypothetical protein